MKKILGYIIAVAALVLAASCTREFDNSYQEGEVFAFELSCAEMTKGEQTPGVGTENEVVSLDYFFYADTTAAAKFHYRVDKPDMSGSGFKTVFEPGVEYGDGNVFPMKEVLYGDNDHTTVFIVANMPSTIEVGSPLPTLADLKAEGIDQSFAVIENEKAKALPTEGEDDVQKVRLVMTAQADVKGSLVANYTQNHLTLERLAAKVNFNITIKSKTFNKTEGTGEDAVTYTETWKPMLSGENVRVYLEKAVTNAILGAADERYPESPTRIDYEELYPFKTTTSTEAPEQANIQVGPFYTYPISWTEDPAQSVYGKFIIPWEVKRTTGSGENTMEIYSAQPEVYYKVVMPEMAILSNNYYELTVTIEPLGTEFQPEVTINATCQVIDWADGGASHVNPQVSDIKFLTVDRSKEVSTTFGDTTTDANVFSGSSNLIQYNASGSAVIDWTKSEVYYYNNKPAGTSTTPVKTTIASATANGWISLIRDGDHYNLQINHTLNNNMASSNFDSSPYYFDLWLCLGVDHEVGKRVRFKQEPSIYIIAYQSGYVTGSSTNTTYTGYAFVNGYRGVNSSYDDNGQGNNTTNYLGSIQSSLANSNNKNNNQYSVTVSVLTSANSFTYDGTNYQMVIGDPRGASEQLSTLNLGNRDTETGGGNKQYRPASEDLSRINYVAPKFIIASSYGATTATSYIEAKKRCAAYQENGYPAGRWRLPTPAEILFIMTLSQKQRIPDLFSPGQTSAYWASGEKAIGYTYTGTGDNQVWTINDVSGWNFAWNNGNNWDRSAGVYSYRNYNYYGVWTRCVYDEWYWGDEKLSTQESWGGFKTERMSNN